MTLKSIYPLSNYEKSWRWWVCLLPLLPACDNFEKPNLLQQTMQDFRRLRLAIIRMNRSQLHRFSFIKFGSRPASSIGSTRIFTVSLDSISPSEDYSGRPHHLSVWNSPESCGCQVQFEYCHKDSTRPGRPYRIYNHAVSHEHAPPRYSSTKAVGYDYFGGHILLIHVIHPWNSLRQDLVLVIWITKKFDQRSAEWLASEATKFTETWSSATRWCWWWRM